LINVLSLLKILESTYPEHDTPVGLIHPYWARKPLNIVQQLVHQFSKKGDTVVDPFVGSGTTVFAALSEGRKAIASDLNPLSIFITGSIVELLESSENKIKAAHKFVEDLSDDVLPMFLYYDDYFVERERFVVKGEFEHGGFKLISTEVVLKRMSGKRLKGRRVEAPISSWTAKKISAPLSNSPINFEALKLLPNSRIAIPNGATLAHYYEYKNQITINLALKIIESGKYGRKNENVLKLLLSASLPLLRLSDKKASSQWPYWRPKEHLTSRNPIPVLQKKLVAIEKAVEWLKENVAVKSKQKISNRVQLYNAPIQSLIPEHVKPGQADLVLTDPPYSDQAPYLEYSALWIELIGLKLPLNAYKHEIVKTDAPARVNDTNDYIPRLREGLRVCAHLLKQDGFLIWFYQDHSVEHWAALDEEAVLNGLNILEVLPLSKQRRSIKTVTSPGTTLDGDLIIIFKKTTIEASQSHTIEKARKIIIDELTLIPATSSYFDKYAAIVKACLKFHLFGLLSQSYNDIRKILPSMYNWR
jgi:16S rRNA G966 N2-methylase RsmD